jgi:ribosomal protein S18 acetylase RimI-like enzyme
MSLLRPMRAENFDAFFAAATASYAHDNVAAGRWSEGDALDLAVSETRTRLSQGIATDGHFLFEITPEDLGTTVGYVWVASLKRGSRSVAVIYQLLVLPEFRRRGYGRAALLEAEAFAQSSGYGSIVLNVFASNDAARALYASLGYQPVSMSLTKSIQ